MSSVRPRDVVGKTRRRLGSELIGELVVIDKKIKTAKQELTDLVVSTGSRLMDLAGIGPSGAARLLGDIADIARFSSRAHFASWNDTAPIDASSGEKNRHRLSRAGNRPINRALHIMAIVQLHRDTEGRRYYRRRLAAGKTAMEALRALKRRLSDIVYLQTVADARLVRTGPGGHAGATLQSSAADLNPEIDTSESHFPDPPHPSQEQPSPQPLDTQGCQMRGSLAVHARDDGPLHSCPHGRVRRRPPTDPEAANAPSSACSHARELRRSSTGSGPCDGAVNRIWLDVQLDNYPRRGHDGSHPSSRTLMIGRGYRAAH
ncbi:transposase [Micromonospora sp. NPDC007271]|uniref:transposase n=1 Tax=Micromonospora sp. NPDC007271 TaxID=3154587 RepID=UPI0033D5F841